MLDGQNGAQDMFGSTRAVCIVCTYCNWAPTKCPGAHPQLITDCKYAPPHTLLNSKRFSNTFPMVPSDVFGWVPGRSEIYQPHNILTSIFRFNVMHWNHTSELCTYSQRHFHVHCPPFSKSHVPSSDFHLHIIFQLIFKIVLQLAGWLMRVYNVYQWHQ